MIESGTPAASAVYPAASAASAASAKECFLNITPDPTIMEYLYELVISNDSPSPLAREMPAAATPDIKFNISEHPVLINSCHGGLPVVRIKNRLSKPEFFYQYRHFIARSKIRRLIKAPPTCCTYSFPEARQEYFDAVNERILDLDLPKDNELITQILKDALRDSSFDMTEDQRTEVERLQSGTEEIFVNSDRAFEYVETDNDKIVINKLFTTDNVTPRGILFCNDVTITVNNSWFSVISPYDTIINNTRRGYTIGDYDREKGTIRYTKGTNLLSCPYFMCFASRCLGVKIIKHNNSLSLGPENTHLIQMVTQVTAEVLYLYFFKQPFLFIDMSCESLCYHDIDGTLINPDEARVQLRSDGYEPQLAALQNIRQYGYHRIRGGNHKKRYNHKKQYKTKMYKTKKRCKTKKYKTKKYKTKKHRK